MGGRAEEYGWTVSTNDSGLVIEWLSLQAIRLGGRILTQIYKHMSWAVSRQINITDLQVSGYFGSEITHEIGLIEL